MRLFIVAAVASVALAGCQSTAERRAALDAEHDTRCQSLGAAKGSDAYVNCRVQLMQVAAVEEQTSQAKRAAFADAMSRVGQNYSRAANSYRPVNCTSYRSGNYVNTNCY